MGKKQYAILMDRRAIQDDIYLFFPEYLVSGEWIEEEEEEYFRDEFKNVYYSMDDYQTMIDNPKKVVGNVISEEELLKKIFKLFIGRCKGTLL